MRNCSRLSGKYHANSPAAFRASSSTLLERRSVTTVTLAVSPRKPRYTTVRFAGLPFGFTVASWKYFA